MERHRHTLITGGAGFEDMHRRVPDIAKIKRTVGWEPTISLDETLRQVIDYEKAKKRKNLDRINRILVCSDPVNPKNPVNPVEFRPNPVNPVDPVEVISSRRSYVTT